MGQMTPTATAYTTGPWSLDDLFPNGSSERIEAAIDALNRDVDAFVARRDDLNDSLSGADFLAMIEAYEGLTRHITRLGAYAALDFSADTQSQTALTLQARVRQLGAEFGNKTLFFSLWWKELDDATAESYMEAATAYRYWLERLRQQRQYTLSEAEEKIINLKNVNGSQALTTLYSSIVDRYSYEMTIDGETKSLTRAQLSPYITGPDPELRAAAYQTQLSKFAADAPVLGQIYQYIIRDWRSENVQLRQFATPISTRNLANDVPDAAVDTLLDVSQENAGIFQRYFKLKAQLLGMDKLRRYDLYAPLSQSDAKFSFDDAVNEVLNSFADYDSDIAGMAAQIFADNHYDSEVRPGKRGGAFCASVLPEMSPWILQSFAGGARDVATMAHELGHGIHAVISNHQNSLQWRPSLPLAETASTFSEMLLLDRLMAQTDDEDVRRDLLIRQMDDNYATIMRQAFFAAFERDAHAAVVEGASVDDLSELYMGNLRTQFGDSMDLSDDFQHEWVAVPHFYQSPFYVYAYAFGQLLALSLYQQYQAEGDAFKPRFRAILAAGGSESPATILSRAGIDIYSAEFWQGGFDVLARAVTSLESLSN